MSWKLSVALLLFAAWPLGAQVRATTSTGESVILNPDGTWRYAAERSDTPFPVGTRSVSATERIDLLGGAAALYHDQRRWRVADSDAPGRPRLEHVKGDAYAMVISERIQVPLTTLRYAVLQNAQKVDPEADITRERRLRVNGADVLEVQLRATVQGIPLTYLNYLYSGPSGTIQVLTWTSPNLFSEFRADLQTLLNGLTVR